MRTPLRCSLFVLLAIAACGGSEGASGGLADAVVSATPQAQLVHSMPPGSESTASIRTLPNSVCTLHAANDSSTTGERLRVFSDDDGIARVHLQHVDLAISEADLALDCVDDSGDTFTHRLTVKIDESATPQAPARYGTAGKRVLPPLQGDPLAPSREELASQGYPPRPDPVSSPLQFAQWTKLVASSPTIITPHIVSDPTRFHGIASAASVAGKSGNWSGYVITTPSTSSPYEEIFGVWNVPRAYAESGFWYLRYSSMWVGMDGFGSPDVVQAGTEQDTQTIFGIQASSYEAWTEWYPYNEQSISNFPVNPGDEIYTWVWVGTSKDVQSPTGGYGWYYVWNTTENAVAAYLSTKAPSGTTFNGHQAEWIMERPTESGSVSSLANYSTAEMYQTEAWDYAGATHEYTSDHSIQVSMYDGSDLLSTVAPLDDYTMKFTWHNYN